MDIHARSEVVSPALPFPKSGAFTRPWLYPEARAAFFIPCHRFFGALYSAKQLEGAAGAALSAWLARFG
jgi:hypothetical protein